jgi:hypothetical protein
VGSTREGETYGYVETGNMGEQTGNFWAQLCSSRAKRRAYMATRNMMQGISKRTDMQRVGPNSETWKGNPAPEGRGQKKYSRHRIA